MPLDKDRISFLILPSRFPPAEHLASYQRAYACWKEVWGHAFKEEMNVPGQLHSDNFTRQSHVAILFYGDELACLTTLNQLDLQDQVALDDSYFKVWPELALRKLQTRARNIISCGNMSVAFDFRGGAKGVSWKDLMFAMLVRYVKDRGHDAMVAAVRLEKGMEKSAYRTGAVAISKDLPYSIEGQRVDIVSWYANLEIASIDPALWEIVQHVRTQSWRAVENRENYQGVKDAA